MLKRLVLVAALCVAPALVRAQEGGLSIKAGLSYDHVSNSGALPGSVTQRSGIAFGVSAVSSGTIGLGIDVLYAQRGVTSSVATAARHLDYLDVPVYVRVALPMASMMPFAYAGPQASFELKCGAGSLNCPDTGRPKAAFAGVIGGGLRFGARRGVSVEGRYVYGLTDLKLSTVSTTTSYQTRSFLLLAGIGF